MARALAVLVLLAAGAPTRQPAAEDAVGPSIRAAATRPSAPDSDLWRIRNIFRYGDESRAAEGPRAAPMGPPVTGPDETPSPLPRAHLVGLVQRGERRVAALSIDGEVVVLGEGESSGEFTVLLVGDEGVSLRGPGGEERTLRLP